MSDARADLYNSQQIYGLGKSVDKKDRRIRALKGVITRQKKKILFLESILEGLDPDWKEYRLI